MSFLKKFGLVLAKGLQLVSGFGPIIGGIVPGSAGIIAKVDETLQKVVAIVMNTEAIGVALSLTGPQKLQAAAPLVAQEILQSALLVGHKIADEAKFTAASIKITEGVVDLLNSLHEDGVQTADKT